MFSHEQSYLVRVRKTHPYPVHDMDRESDRRAPGGKQVSCWLMLMSHGISAARRQARSSYKICSLEKYLPSNLPRSIIDTRRFTHLSR
jgi:hypothetical protein